MLEKWKQIHMVLYGTEWYSFSSCINIERIKMDMSCRLRFNRMFTLLCRWISTVVNYSLKIRFPVHNSLHCSVSWQLTLLLVRAILSSKIMVQTILLWLVCYVNRKKLQLYKVLFVLGFVSAYKYTIIYRVLIVSTAKYYRISCLFKYIISWAEKKCKLLSAILNEIQVTVGYVGYTW